MQSEEQENRIFYKIDNSRLPTNLDTITGFQL